LNPNAIIELTLYPAYCVFRLVYIKKMKNGQHKFIVIIQEPEARIKRKPALVMAILCQCST